MTKTISDIYEGPEENRNIQEVAGAGHGSAYVPRKDLSYMDFEIDPKADAEHSFAGARAQVPAAPPIEGLKKRLRVPVRSEYIDVDEPVPYTLTDEGRIAAGQLADDLDDAPGASDMRASWMEHISHYQPAETIISSHEKILDTEVATVKPSNPKDAYGVKKTPMSTVPAQVMMEIGVGMLEGAVKYARHNYRVVGVRSSVYYDAAMRHMMLWWEGQDLDPDSGLSHVTKAMASLVVLRDAMLQGKLEDDRPPTDGDPDWMLELNRKAAEIIEKYPDPKPAHTRGGVK